VVLRLEAVIEGDADHGLGKGRVRQRGSAEQSQQKCAREARIRPSHDVPPRWPTGQVVQPRTEPQERNRGSERPCCPTPGWFPRMFSPCCAVCARRGSRRGLREGRCVIYCEWRSRRRTSTSRPTRSPRKCS